MSATETIDQTANRRTINGMTIDTVSLDDIIVGRRLESPLFDVHGVLLLAAGSIVTREIKQAIRNRGDRNVCLSKQDAKRLTLQQNSVSSLQHTTALGGELSERIDAIMDSGLLSVKNKGPAVKNDVVFLGRKGYDPEQRSRLLDQHEKNNEALGAMISDALNGQPIDGSVVSTMAAEYLREMTTDTDSVLESAVSQFEDDNISGRSLEVSLLAMAIGIEMDLDEDNIKHLAMAGLVNDWGMLRVPSEIRSTGRPLTEIEMLEVKKHPIYSLELLQQVSSLPRVVSVVSYQVHERFNGTGYPRGRCGHSIHPFSRILQVADTFVSLTTSRPYRPPFMRYAAMECLIRQAKERAVDPEVVRALLKIQTLFPIGSFVALSDGSVARVLRRNRDLYTQPIIERIQDADGNPVDSTADENIIDLSNSEGLTIEQALPTPGIDEIPLTDELYQASLNALF
ncbi:HD-GYP domain-containing protein [Rubinisphaera sp. JC750]|uniref:HD-GYP domain-containing protein n=1 Tax=Rubinisphaera sp. JC750 TaxID=2898658 RepID=UPI001F30ADBD|nr:HD domain-containing phosphohydrolase [Rubinisphaera sp. JC750]